MHPNPAFHDLPEEEALAFAGTIAFAHIMTVIDGRPAVAHAPIVRSGDRSFRFHLARGNRLTRHLDAAPVAMSLAGPHGYITPNWYQAPAGQVPTWNYIAVELEGTTHAIPDEELIEQLDALALAHEPGLSPAPWTRHKMDPASFDAMRKAIRGFEMTVETIRATNKLGQNKSGADRRGVVAGLEASGNAALAQAMRAIA